MYLRVRTVMPTSYDARGPVCRVPAPVGMHGSRRDPSHGDAETPGGRVSFTRLRDVAPQKGGRRGLRRRGQCVRDDGADIHVCGRRRRRPERPSAGASGSEQRRRCAAARGRPPGGGCGGVDGRPRDRRAGPADGVRRDGLTGRRAPRLRGLTSEGPSRSTRGACRAGRRARASLRACR